MGIHSKSTWDDENNWKKGSTTGGVRGRTPQDILEVEREDGDKNISARPNRLLENLGSAIDDGGPGSTIKKKHVYQ